MPYPRKSQEEKELTGTARKDRAEADFAESTLVDGLPESPAFLNKIGRKHWKKCTKLLQNEGVLAENQLDLLGLYCMHLQIAEQAAEVLKNELFMPSVNEQGESYYVGTTAVMRTFNEASSAAVKIGQQFGFTPVSRKNVPAPKAKQGMSRLDSLKQKQADRQSGTVFKVA